MHDDKFERTDRNVTGKYAESLVISAYIRTGCEIAMPFGNQARWDLLVREGGQWREVQIKTARINGLRMIIDYRAMGGSKALRTGKSRRLQSHCDYVVAVYPETGTIWRMKGCDLADKKVLNIPLTLDQVWILGGMSMAVAANYGGETLELEEMGPPVENTGVFVERHLRRLALAKLQIPDERPESISPMGWDTLLKYRDGHSFHAIAKGYGVHYTSVVERVDRAIRHLAPA